MSLRFSKNKSKNESKLYMNIQEKAIATLYNTMALLILKLLPIQKNKGYPRK